MEIEIFRASNRNIFEYYSRKLDEMRRNQSKQPWNRTLSPSSQVVLIEGPRKVVCCLELFFLIYRLVSFNDKVHFLRKCVETQIYSIFLSLRIHTLPMICHHSILLMNPTGLSSFRWVCFRRRQVELCKALSRTFKYCRIQIVQIQIPPTMDLLV